MRARTRSGPRPTGRRCGGPPKGTPSRRRVERSLSLRRGVSLSKARAHVRLLGPCFKTGRKRPFRRRLRPRRDVNDRRRAPSVREPRDKDRPAAETAERTPRSPPFFRRPRVGADERRGRTKRTAPEDPPRLAPDASGVRRSLTVSFQRFQALLTPFSGSFSPFLHSTSSLSVSPPYLALDGINHPLLGCNLKQPDSRKGRRRHRLG